MMFQAVCFGKPIVWPFFFLLCQIMASLTFIGSALVLMLTNTNKRLVKAIKSLESRLDTEGLLRALRR